MECSLCSGVLVRVMDVVKDGTIYHAYRCADGHHVVRDARQDHLPVRLSVEDGVQVARVECGENCYIFDGEMFQAALRKIIRAIRGHGGHLILDLSHVSLVGDGLASAVRALDRYLKGRGRRLVIVAPSKAFRSHLEAAVPGLRGRILQDLEVALSEARPDARSATTPSEGRQSAMS